MPEMPDEAQARLKAMLPFAAPRNPVDCTAQAFNDMTLIGRFHRLDGRRRRNTARSWGSSARSAAQRRSPLPCANSSMRRRAKHPDRLYVLSIVARPEQVQQYEADGFVVFEDPTRAVVAIKAMGRFGDVFAKVADPAPPAMDAVALPATMPTEAEAKLLLAAAGIESAPEEACGTEDCGGQQRPSGSAARW